MKRNHVFHEFTGQNRIDILKYCREKKIGQDQFGAVGINQWKDIYDKVIDHFVDKTRFWKQELHWANTNLKFRTNKPVEFFLESDDELCWYWYRELPHLVYNPADKAYLLVEEGNKFWIFEGYLERISDLLDEGLCYSDYYIVDKHYEWMITENHEDIVLFVGTGFCLEYLKNRWKKHEA